MQMIYLFLGVPLNVSLMHTILHHINKTSTELSRL